MLFARRDRPPLSERVRVGLWPRRSFARSFRYIKLRILRLQGSPHAIAAGVAVGAFASCTPLVGFHFLLSFMLAWVVGGSMIAAALGTAVGNPLTFPLIWVSSYRVGEFLLGGVTTPGPLELNLSFDTIWSSFETIWPTLKLMLVGGALIGSVVGLTLYYLTRSAILVSRNLRAERLAARHKARLAR